MSRWTHAICPACWDARNPHSPAGDQREGPREACCYCGTETLAGIYVRDDPATVRCEGKHA